MSKGKIEIVRHWKAHMYLSFDVPKSYAPDSIEDTLGTSRRT